MPEEKPAASMRGSMPRVVIDPGLPEHIQKAILDSGHQDLLAPAPDSEPSPWWGLCAPIRTERALFGVIALSWFLPLGRHVVGLDGASVCSCVAVAMAYWSAHAVAKRKARIAHLRQLRDAREHYVVPEDLDKSTRELVARAHSAMHTISRSSAHREGLIDHQRDEQRFPFEAWEIASDLAVYSRMVKEAPTQGKSERAEKQLQELRRKLALALDAIKDRVLALEAYADEAVEADRKHAERQQRQEIAARDQAVLDLMANSARHDRASAEMRRAAEETAAVSEAFDSAMRSTEPGADVIRPLSREAD
ncbi:hypothetical protein ABR737_00995 [Streptomyces sp. Edi2]|uniref:hypothetical protein n=1 Tax=Streptomyces sp. Edi2 TaxID=3162528 RepID=UPI0033068793